MRQRLLFYKTLLFSVWFRLAYSGIWIFMYRRRVAYYFSRAHSQSWYYCWSSFRQCIIMRSILCSMSLSVVDQKERKTYRRRRDILRGVRFFVSDLFQKRPSWRGRAGAGPLCLSKKKKNFLSGFRDKFQKRVTCVAFQSNLRKQIRKLPKFLKSVKIIH